MRFYSWKMLLYISSLTVTGIVSGIYLLKVTGCNWWNFLTISLIFLKMILNSKVSTWMAKGTHDFTVFDFWVSHEIGEGFHNFADASLVVTAE